MDKKFTIEVHIGEDYVRFTVGNKQREWGMDNGVRMFKLLKEFINGLVRD